MMPGNEANSPNQGSWRGRLFDFLKIALALVLVMFVVAQVQLSDLVAVWQHVSIPWLLVNIVSFCVGVCIIAYRYWILIAKKISLHETMNVVIVQTVLGNLVSAGVGALFYVAVLRGKYQVQLRLGVGSLLFARFSDLVAVMAGLILSSWILWPQIAILHWLVELVIIAMAGAITLFALILIWRQRLIGLLEKILRSLHLARITFVKQAMQAIRDLASQDIEQLRSIFGSVVICTCLSYVTMFLYAYSALRMFGAPVGAWSVVFVFSLLQLMSIIPIQVFGGLGVQDVTNVYLYGLFGLGRSEIVPVIISSRIFFYLVNLLLLGYLVLDSRLGRFLRS